MAATAHSRSVEDRLLRGVLKLGAFAISSDFAARYPDAAIAIAQRRIANVQDYYVEFGSSRFQSPNPCVLPEVYVEALRRSGRQSSRHPLLDYIENGGAHAAPVHWLFDESTFQQEAPAVRDAVAKRNLISAYVYYLSQAQDDMLDGVRPHWIFDPGFYRKRYGVRGNTLLHFLQEGQFQGHTPGVLFDPDYYVTLHRLFPTPDRDGYPFSPLQHFINGGMRAGHVPIPDFDPAFYLRFYPDVGEGIGRGIVSSAFEHFGRFGHIEGRDPNPFFSNKDYLELNPEVRRELSPAGPRSPFEHFLLTGYKRGLRARMPLQQAKVPEEWGKALFEKRAAARMQEYVHTRPDWSGAAAPTVSCIVPVFNNFMFTCSLLAQLHAEFGRYQALEVIVVDNGSTDGTNSLESNGRLRIVRVPEPIGYTKACNIGAGAAAGSIFVFLNNDIEIEPGSIERIAGLVTDQQTIYGPRILLATGELQEAGGYVYSDGAAIGYGRTADPTSAAFLYRREVDYVSGCFMVVPRNLFESLGGFDEQFSPGYYEDTDLCLRTAQRGGRVVYEPRLRITHYEYASYSSGRPPKVSSALMARNEIAFRRKHRDWLRSHGRDRVLLKKAVFAASTWRRPEVLIIEDLIPAQDTGSGFPRTASVIDSLGELGYSVCVWPVNSWATAPVPIWREAGATIEVVDVRTWGRNLARFLNEQGDRFEWIWICRTHNYRGLGETIRHWKGKSRERRIIFDTEAIAAPRDVALLRLMGRETSPSELLQRTTAELGDLEAVDTILVVNRLDASLIERSTGIRPEILGQRYAAAPSVPGWNLRKDIGFLGAFFGRNNPNYDSIVWFVREVLPRLRTRQPGLVLKIAGHFTEDIADDEVFRSPGVQFVGSIADLAAFFSTIRVFVAPTRYAGGLPLKVQHAMSYGVPSVVTDLLARQLDLDPNTAGPVRVANVNDARAFMEGVTALYSNEALWKEASEASLDYVRRNCSPERFTETVAKVIGKV